MRVLEHQRASLIMSHLGGVVGRLLGGLDAHGFRLVSIGGPRAAGSFIYLLSSWSLEC